MRATATYDSETGTFTLTKGVWSGTFPISDLSKWLAFYRDQRQRFPAYAANYDDDVRVLEELAQQTGSTGGKGQEVHSCA